MGKYQVYRKLTTYYSYIETWERSISLINYMMKVFESRIHTTIEKKILAGEQQDSKRPSI